MQINYTQAGVETAAAATSTHQQLQQLLNALWRSPDLVHQIGVLNRHGGGFANFPIKGGVDAIASVQPFLAFATDIYFAVAEYKSPDNRTADNAAGAWALWLDIDVAPEKVATGKGYATLEEANAALTESCVRAGITEPTHLVASGSGLHAYWALTAFLDREAWLKLARMFKVLTQALGLRADPARTADIASVMRIPGTLNYKTNPPKPVTLLAATDTFIDTEAMAVAIHVAFEKHCASSIELTPATGSGFAGTASTPESGDFIEPPNFAQLTSALMGLDPDCDEYAWIFHRIAPMANTAAGIPEIADRLYQLAKEWSSGELRGVPSKKWHTPGGNGLTGKQYFDRVWIRFLKGKYVGKKTTLATIFFHAKQAGWIWKYRDSANHDGEEIA